MPPQLALMQGLHTNKLSRASSQIVDAERQHIARRDEEATLVRTAKSGDGQAFEVLVARYQQRLLSVARRFTRIREDAEDIVQQSFQKAFVHLHKFEGKSSFFTWLTRIAINEALMFLRKGRGRREISIDDISGDEETALRLEIPDSRPGPESAFLQDERSRILSAAMNKLTPRTRKTIELKELGGLSTEEAASVMGLSVAVVKGRLFHGRRKLHKVLLGSPLGNLVRSRQFNCERKRRNYELKERRNDALNPRTGAIQPRAENIGRALGLEEIRLRAYEIHRERGGFSGNELDDWLPAGRELRRAAAPKAQQFRVAGETE
jgi:RNA polymerase sigma-70 factor (ECF subfamily)